MNPNLSPVQPPKRTTSQSIASFANLAPGLAQQSPATVANVGAQNYQPDEQMQLAQHLEVMQWAGSVKRLWEQSTEEQRLAYWKSLGDAERAVLGQYGGMQPPKEFKNAVTKALYHASPQSIISDSAKGVVKFFDWWHFEVLTPSARASASFLKDDQAANIDDDLTGFARWKVYFDLARDTSEGDYFAGMLNDISARYGFDEIDRMVLTEAGMRHRRNWLPDDKDQRRQLSGELIQGAIDQMVFDGIIDAEAGLAARRRMAQRLEDASYVEGFAELVGAKNSIGRGIAHGLRLDPTTRFGPRDRLNPFTFVSGSVDSVIAFLDPTMGLGKGVKGWRALTRSVGSVDDMIKIGVGAGNLGGVAARAGIRTGGVQHYDEIMELAVRKHGGNSAAAAAEWMAANPDQVKPGLNRLAERFARQWNEDLAIQVAARNGQDVVEEVAEGVARTRRFKDLGFQRLQKENPVLAGYSQDLYQRWHTIADEAGGAAARLGPDATDASRIVVREQFTTADVYRAMFDDQIVSNIVQGKYGGWLRNQPIMPMLNAMEGIRISGKLMMRAPIDWLNDSNYRLLKRFVDAGKFGELGEDALARAGSVSRVRSLLKGEVQDVRPTAKPGDTLKMSDPLSLVDKARVIVASGAQSLGTAGAFFTRQYPGSRILNVMDGDSVKQVESLAALLPADVGGRIVSLYASSTEVGERALVLRGLFAELFNRNGLMDTAAGRAFADNFLNREMFGEVLDALPPKLRKQFESEAGHIYSVASLDKIALGNYGETASAIFGFQTTSQVALPNFQRLFGLSRRQSFWANALGVNLFNNRVMDKLITGTWAPAVLMRLGFPLRAGGEEALQFVLREGYGAYLKGRVAASAFKGSVKRRGRELTAGARKPQKFLEMDVLPDGLRVPARRGNYALLRVTELIEKTPWSKAGLTDAMATRLSDSRRLLGSATIGAIHERLTMMGPTELARLGLRGFHRTILRKDNIRAIDKLVAATDGDAIMKYMADISSGNISRFYKAQMSGGGGYPSSLSAHSMGAGPDDKLLEHVLDGRFAKFDLDTDFGYEAWQKFLWSFSQSDSPIDQYLLQLLAEASEEAAGDPIRVIRENIEAIVQEVLDNPELLDDFQRLIRANVTQGDSPVANKVVGFYGDPDFPVPHDPDVLFWHGTRTPFSQDRVLEQLIDAQGDTAQAVNRVRRIRSLQAEQEWIGSLMDEAQELTHQLQEIVRLTSGVADDVVPDLPDMFVGSSLRAMANSGQFVDEAPTVVTRFMMHSKDALKGTDEEVGQRFWKFLDDKAKELQDVTRRLEDDARRILDEYDIDALKPARGISAKEQERLNELKVRHDQARERAEQLNEQLEFMGMDADGAIVDQLQDEIYELMVETHELQLRIERIHAQAVDTDAVGLNNLDAIALNDPRLIDSSQGTGVQMYTSGLYATNQIEEGLNYSTLRHGDNVNPRVYGVGFEGEWKPLSLDAPLPDHAVDTVREMLTNLVSSLPEERLFTVLYRHPSIRPFLNYTKLDDAGKRAVKAYDQSAVGGVEDIRKVGDIEVKQIVSDLNYLADTLAGTGDLSVVDDMWLEVMTEFQTRLGRLGYTGAEHSPTNTPWSWNAAADGGGRPHVNYIVWDTSRLKFLQEWDSAQVMELAGRQASRREAVSNLLQTQLEELQKRTYLFDNQAQPVRLLYDDLFSDIYEGRIPQTDEIRRLNILAQEDTVLKFDPERLDTQLVMQTQEAGLGPDVEGKVYDAIERVKARAQEAADAAEGHVAHMKPDQFRHLFDELETLGLVDEDAITRITTTVTRQDSGRLWREVTAPLTTEQKKNLTGYLFQKPFEVIGAVIDSISRHPMWFYNYLEGLKHTATHAWKYRQAERGLYEIFERIADGKPGYLDDLVRRGTRTLDDAEDVILRSVTDTHAGNAPQSVAKVNVKTREVVIDEYRLRNDFEYNRLGYLYGEEQLAGSRQKHEVMHRLGVDRDELHTWLKDNGGLEKYREFVLEHERAHIALGHKGVHSGDWMLEGAIHQEVEATYVALRRIGAEHLATPPASGIDLFDARKLLDDVKAAYRRLAKQARKDGADGFDIDDLLRDHYAYDTIQEFMAEARKVGFVQEDGESLFAFTERVITRVADAELDHIEHAAGWAFNATRQHVDSVSISSFGQTLMRNMTPFMWAEERFIKRSLMTMFHSPEALKRLHLMYMGMRNVGLVYTDERTGNDYFVYPWTKFAYSGVAQVFHTIFGGEARKIGIVGEGGERLADDLGLSDYINLRGRPFLTIPGLDALGRPQFGPMFALPLHFMQQRFPTVGNVQTSKVAEALLGPISGDPDRPAWSKVVPSAVYNTYRAMNAEEEYASDMLTALSVLAANDLLPDDTEPGSWEVFNDRLEEQMKIIGLLRVAYGWAGVAPPEIEWSGSEVQQDLIKAIQNYGFEEGYLVWQEANPDATVWSVFGTTTAGGAPIPASEDAFNFLTENEWLSGFKHAAPYVVPRDDPGDGTSEFYQRAWSQQFAMGLRERRTTEEMYRAMRYAQVAPLYFEERRQYEEARKVVAGTPQAAEIDHLWGQRQIQFRTQFPTFWAELTSNDRQQRRDRIVLELNSMVAEGRIPLNETSEATMVLLDGFNRYRAQMDSVTRIQTAEARQYRRFLRETFAAWSWQQIHQMPQGESFYYRVIAPEIQLPEDELAQIQQLALPAGAAS